MPDLSPIETLSETSLGPELPLPEAIASIYGRLAFPEHPGRPYVISNFVTTLDGVVTLGIPGHSGGGDISGFNKEDRFLMGLLRAATDVVIISSAILTVAPSQVWTAAAVFPPMEQAYQELRAAMGKKTPPITAIITSRGEINPGLRVFQEYEGPVVILTTEEGAQRISARNLSAAGHQQADLNVLVARPEGPLQADEIITALQNLSPEGLYLMEAGPHLHAEFIAGKRLDEIFLTLAPQVAGRIGADIRPGLVADRIFAPEIPVWGRLVSIKRSESHLFLRYSL